MTIRDLPTLNAALNLASAILIFVGRIQIKRDRADWHKKIMLSALVFSVLFLTSYSIYHANVGSIPYKHFDWTRPIYFAILIPHVTLAGLMVPFILAAVWFALRKRFDTHRRLVKWVWPVWLFVSLSGIAVYAMLYHL